MLKAVAASLAIALAGACGTGSESSIERGAEGGSLAVVGAGWSFGLCGGACQGDLQIDECGVRYLVTGWNQSIEPYVDNSGVLTEAGEGKLGASVEAVDMSSLEERYGCPDCADGGAAYISLSRESAVSTHWYEFSSPPTELNALDQLLGEIMDALGGCTADEKLSLGDDCVAQGL